MDNERSLNNLKKIFPNLQYFYLANNILTLNYNGHFEMPLISTNLSLLNPNLYYLKPNEIFQVIYVLELLYKNSLSEKEASFILDFTNMYLNLNDLIKSGTLKNEEARVWCLGIPIVKSYENIFVNNPASKIIAEVVNNHEDEIISGKNKQPRLVRTNDSVVNFMPAEPDLNLIDYGKAGFTTLLLIGGAIVFSVIYVTYFIIGH